MIPEVSENTTTISTTIPSNCGLNDNSNEAPVLFSPTGHCTGKYKIKTQSKATQKTSFEVALSKSPGSAVISRHAT